MMGTRERCAEGNCQTGYHLILFIAGDEPNSRTARRNLESLCKRELPDRAQIEIVDVLEDFETAAKHSILVTPTLLVLEPGPTVTIVGNLSNKGRLLAALRLGGESGDG